MEQQTKKLSFICVGVQKAGTTSLHEILRQHPDINLPEFKETHFFSDDQNFIKGLDHYFNYYFSKNRNNLTYGEIDPEYIFFEKSLERIAKASGDAKIIVILRNPVERAYSHYNMTQRRGYEDLGFIKALENEPKRQNDHFEKTHFSYVSRGLYYKQLSKLFSVFQRDKVKIVMYDDYKSSPKKVICEICNFVNIEPIDFNFDITKNKASTAKSNIVRDFIYKDNLIKKLGGKFFKSDKLKLRIMQGIERLNLKEGKIEKLTFQDKKNICKNFFLEDIIKTEKLLKTDLSIWKYDL